MFGLCRDLEEGIGDLFQISAVFLNSSLFEKKRPNKSAYDHRRIYFIPLEKLHSRFNKILFVLFFCSS